MNNMHGSTFRTSVLVALSVAMATSMPSWSQTKQPPKGFFYDAENNRYFSNSEAKFSIRPIEDPKYLDNIQVSIDGNDFKKYEGILRLEKEGPHQIRFRASDAVLNWSPIQDFTIYVDLTPPTSYPVWEGAVYQTSDKLFIHPTTKFKVEVQDSLSGVAKTRWSLKGADNISTIGKFQSFDKEGDHRIRISSHDKVGNEEKWKEVSFFVDATPPSTKANITGFSYKTDKAMYVSSGSAIELLSDDKASGVERIEYKLNGGDVHEYRQPIAVSDNQFNIQFRGVDHVGNAEPWKAMTVKQDPEPPVIAVKEIGNSVPTAGKIFVRSGFKLQVEASDSDSGLKEINFFRNGSKDSTGPRAVMTFDKPGEYFVQLKATDHVGNTQEANPYTIIVDNDPPTTTLNTSHPLVEKGGIFLSAVPNRLEVTGEDNGVGLKEVEYSFDGKTFKTLDKAILVEEWKSTQNTLYFRGVDRLGNTEKTHSKTINVRHEGPKVALFVEAYDYPSIPLSKFRENLKQAKLNLAKEAKRAKKEGDKKPVLEKKVIADSKKSEDKKKVKSKPKKRASKGRSRSSKVSKKRTTSRSKRKPASRKKSKSKSKKKRSKKK